MILLENENLQLRAHVENMQLITQARVYYTSILYTRLAMAAADSILVGVAYKRSILVMSPTKESVGHRLHPL